MIRSFLLAISYVAFGLMAVGGLLAQGADVTLTGKVVCARCFLGEAAKCQNAIQIQEKDKVVTYYFLDKGNGEAYHRAVCGGQAKAGSVTGVVSEKDGRKWITPKKVEYAKAETSTSANWIESYGDGMAQGRKEGKPVAVVVANGASGWKKLTKEGAWTADAEQALVDRYVPIYVDASTASGKQLATALGVPGGVGLVISDKTGDLVAHRHQGEIGCTDLTACLDKFCGGKGCCHGPNCPVSSVATTSTNPAAVTAPLQGTVAAPAKAGGAAPCCHK